MRNSAAFLSHIVLAASLGLSPIAVHAVSLSGVVIGSNVYTVTFTQNGDGETAFNDVYGSGDPSLTFVTAGDASAAATAVLAAVGAGSFDFAPLTDRNGFIVPWSYDTGTFRFVQGLGNGDDFCCGVSQVGSPANRTEVFELSFATFQVTGQAVPEPGTLALLGLGLLGLGLTRRKAA